MSALVITDVLIGKENSVVVLPSVFYTAQGRKKRGIPSLLLPLTALLFLPSNLALNTSSNNRIEAHADFDWYID